MATFLVFFAPSPALFRFFVSLSAMFAYGIECATRKEVKCKAMARSMFNSSDSCEWWDVEADLKFLGGALLMAEKSRSIR